jgi:hypothetical protein
MLVWVIDRFLPMDYHRSVQRNLRLRPSRRGVSRDTADMRGIQRSNSLLKRHRLRIFGHFVDRDDISSHWNGVWCMDSVATSERVGCIFITA